MIVSVLEDLPEKVKNQNNSHQLETCSYIESLVMDRAANYIRSSISRVGLFEVTHT